MYSCVKRHTAGYRLPNDKENRLSDEYSHQTTLLNEKPEGGRLLFFVPHNITLYIYIVFIVQYRYNIYIILQ